LETANKLAALQKIKREKCVLFGALWNDFKKQKKYEEGK
jgi:hypothetical protein